MPNILVADKIAEQGIERLKAAPDVTYDVRHGLSTSELASIVGDYDGMLIRSAVKVTRDVFANVGKLAVIARAGVGVDNVDLDAATGAGVLVLNTPDANTLSTAEHSIALMLALYRHIPAAHQHVTAGQWNRSGFQGQQLAGKTLGIVGFGRIGRTVAQRARAFEMNVLAYDPFISSQTDLRDPGAPELVPDLDTLLRESDCVTLHSSLTDETRHMIGAAQFALMKPTAILINCARGALIDEAALADALNEGRLGGAGIDVYAKEPPVGSPLLSARNVVLTPHLAASTSEAQAQVSVDAVDALLAYLIDGEIRSAVNVTGLPGHLTPRLRAYLDLCCRMGALLSPWCASGVDRLCATVCGESLQEIADTLSWQAMVSVLRPHLDVRLNVINAKDQAKHRGITVEHAIKTSNPDLPDALTLTVETQGKTHIIEGTIFADGKPRVLSIDGYKMELVPAQSMALIFNDDQPGVIGLVGREFGDAGINIADMVLSRRDKTALMVLKLDQAMPDALRDALRAKNPPILSVCTVTLPPVGDGHASP
ncbi:MAG: phosphoglycerate dehydrogenase [Planctomycetes bacterium]|nr:phosphoglycerate dehydrogenase [Planctomycetota bacterium]